MGDFIKYAMPDFSKCGPAVQDIGPSFMRTIDFLKNFGDSGTNTGSWTYEWFDCFSDIPLTGIMWCLCGSCCIPARTLEASLPPQTCESYCLSALATNFVCLGPCYMAAKRQDMRNKYNIKGSPAEDIILSCCLGPCTACQEAREVGAREANYTIPYTLVGTNKTGATPAKAPEVQAMDRKEGDAAPAVPAAPAPVTTAVVEPEKKSTDAPPAKPAA